MKVWVYIPHPSMVSFFGDHRMIMSFRTCHTEARELNLPKNWKMKRVNRDVIRITIELGHARYMEMPYSWLAFI